MNISNFDLMDIEDFKKLLKSEVDKANKRLKRMNNFQKRLFEDKGITHISRAGTQEQKIKALSLALYVNESGISTKKEYEKYRNSLAQDLSLSKKEVDYMLNSIDISTMSFMSNTPLKYGSNPQVDFLYEDVIQVKDNLQMALLNAKNYENQVKSLADTITSLTSTDIIRK